MTSITAAPSASSSNANAPCAWPGLSTRSDSFTEAPKPQPLPAEVWINPPDAETTPQIAEQIPTIGVSMSLTGSETLKWLKDERIEDAVLGNHEAMVLKTLMNRERRTRTGWMGQLNEVQTEEWIQAL